MAKRVVKSILFKNDFPQFTFSLLKVVWIDLTKRKFLNRKFFFNESELKSIAFKRITHSFYTHFYSIIPFPTPGCDVDCNVWKKGMRGNRKRKPEEIAHPFRVFGTWSSSQTSFHSKVLPWLLLVHMFLITEPWKILSISRVLLMHSHSSLLYTYTMY